jgi:hypothetical protein
MAKIGLRTVNEASDLIASLLQTYVEDIEQAWLSCEGDAITVNLKVKIKPENRGNEINAEIGFVSSRIKDVMSATVDEDQITMEFEERGDPGDTEGQDSP